MADVTATVDGRPAEVRRTALDTWTVEAEFPDAEDKDAIAREILQTMTTFTGAGGKVVAGKTDVEKLTTKSANFTLSKIDTNDEAWQAAVMDVKERHGRRRAGEDEPTATQRHASGHPVSTASD